MPVAKPFFDFLPRIDRHRARIDRGESALDVGELLGRHRQSLRIVANRGSRLAEFAADVNQEKAATSPAAARRRECVGLVLPIMRGDAGVAITLHVDAAGEPLRLGEVERPLHFKPSFWATAKCL